TAPCVHAAFPSPKRVYTTPHTSCMRTGWMLDDLDLSNSADEHARRAIQLLLNLVETLAAENRSLREEIQRLRDENNRLKGEQAKPNIKPNKRPPPADHSSEGERHQPRPHQKGRKVEQITIDRTEDCQLDRAILPP